MFWEIFSKYWDIFFHNLEPGSLLGSIVVKLDNLNVHNYNFFN